MNTTENRRKFIINILYIAIVVVLVYGALKFVLPFLMPFVLAFIIAFALNRPINFISRKTKLKRKPCAVLTLTLFYLLFFSIFALIISRIVVGTAKQLQNLPFYYESYIEPAIVTINSWIDSLFSESNPTVSTLLDTVGNSITSGLSNVVTSISQWAIGFAANIAQGVPGIVLGTFLMIISSFFFVSDYNKINGFIFKQFSENISKKIRLIKDYGVNVLFKYAKAYFIIIIITFVEVSIGMLILKVPLPFLVAGITAIVDILPVLGTGTILIPWSVYMLITGNYFLGIGLLVLYVVIAVIRQIIEPKIVGRQIGLYPLLTLMFMYIGAQLFGIWGMFGLPIVVTVIIYLNRTKEIHWFNE